MDPQLALLLRSSCRMTPAEMCGRLGWERGRLAVALAAAEREGWRLERSPMGVRLLSAPPELDADEIAHRLDTMVIGRSVRVVRFTESTNDLARAALAAGRPEGEAVFAEQQTAGRGRFGRGWTAPRFSSLLLSVGLTPRPPALERLSLLNLAAAVAVADAVAALSGREAAIRWPNDVLVAGAKISGILVESNGAGGGCVVGIGLNVNQAAGDFPPGLRTPATSLAMLAGEPADRTLAARNLLRALDRRYAQLHNDAGAAEIRTAWRARCDLPGRRVHLLVEGRPAAGRVIDLADDGRLLFQADGGPPAALRPEVVGGLTVVDA